MRIRHATCCAALLLSLSATGGARGAEIPPADAPPWYQQTLSAVGGAVKAVEPVPYLIDGAFTPRLIKGDRAQSILGDVWRSSRGPFAQ